MRKGDVIKRVPIPEELSDLLCDMLSEAKIQMRNSQGDDAIYAMLLQPWFDEEQNMILEANFAVVDEAGFRALNAFLQKEFNTPSSMPFTTKKGNLVMPDYDSDCVKAKKGIHDYGEPKYHHLVKPPVYIDGEDMVFTEEYEHDKG